MLVDNANSVDPDQTSHSVASDLGLHCLLMSHLWDARHKWVNMLFQTILQSSRLYCHLLCILHVSQDL